MSDKELGQSQDVLHKQSVVAVSYVCEEDDDKKKETPTPAEGIPIIARSMSCLSFAADDTRVLAESLIDTQRSNIDHF